jgi:hypothetical protein
MLAFALFAQSMGLAGCASTPQASAERDAEAKQFGSAPATAAVYVYRNDTAHEDSVLWIDGRVIGSTLRRTFFRVHLEPGRHLLSGMAADNGHLILETRPGAVYFVALTVVAGQSHFQRVPDASGRKTLVNCCTLMENWAPGQRPLLR